METRDRAKTRHANVETESRPRHDKKLIRRRDSERELFYDDMVHVEASVYAH